MSSALEQNDVDGAAGAADDLIESPRAGRAGRGAAAWFFFILFMLTAIPLFAAPVLLPVVRDYTRMLEEEQALSLRVARLEERARRLDEFAAAVQADPHVNERLARMELGYTRPGESVIMVDPSPGAASSAQAGRWFDDAGGRITPPDWPDWAQRAESWAAQRGLIAAFMDPSLRGVWMLLSAGLVFAAFFVFGRRGGPAPRETARQPESLPRPESPNPPD